VQREEKKKSGSYEQSCRTRTRGTFKKVHRPSTREKKQQGGIRMDNVAVDEGRRWGYFVRA